MTKTNIILIVVCGALVINSVVTWIGVGRKGERDALEKVQEQYERMDSDYEMELERLAGEGARLRHDVDVWHGRMDTVKAELSVARGRVKSVEDWFRGRGR